MPRGIGLLISLAAASSVLAQCDELAISSVLTSDPSICGEGTVDLAALGTFPVGTTFQWQLLDTGSWVDLVGGTGSSFNTTLDSSAVFRMVAACGSTTDSTGTLEFTVYELPVVTASAAPAGPFCGATATTLLASGPDSLIWSPNIGLSDTTGSSVPCLASATTTYFVTGLDTATGCSAIDSILIEVVPPPTATNGGSVILCESDANDSISFTLSGTGPWEVTVAGPGGPFDFAGQSDSLLTLQDPEAGAYVISALSTAICPNDPDNNGDTLFVSISAQPSPAEIIAGPDQVCANSTLVLEALSPGIGIGAWTQSAGDPVALTLLSDTSVSCVPTLPGTYTFIWTVQNEPCEANSASYTVNVSGPVPPADAGDDTTHCAGEPVGLDANDPTTGTGIWSVAAFPTGATAAFDDTADPNASFTGDVNGTYVLVWTISHPPCASSMDSVIVTLAGTSAAPSILSPDEDGVCAGEHQTLLIAVPVPGTTYTWTCPDWSEGPLTGERIVAGWRYPSGHTSTVNSVVTVTANGPCPATTEVTFPFSPDPASCPRGIVFFEPYGLAILDEAARYFQWGSLDGTQHFTADPTRTAQSTFDAAHISGCAPYYVARTSIGGTSCWSTTVDCANPEMLETWTCPTMEGMITAPDIRIYPNPAHGGDVTLHVTGGAPELLAIEIGDPGGRTLERAILRVTDGVPAALDLSRYDRGVYILHVRGADLERTVKLVIDR